MIQKISFASRREDKNYVEKLKLHTNALNFNNQRNISQAIDNLSKDSSTKNINFLMNVADQIRYGLNCGITDVKPNNNWMEQLKNATEKSLAKNNTASKEALQARFKQVFENNKELTEQEKTVLSLRENLLKTPGLKNEINTSDNDNVRDINKNLDYFVVSSETSIDEKVQVLEKLNKFMSPEYKIEKQLENKKAQVLGEVLNDIVVKTAEQDRPTIKQVDQRHHGMCAAISIARKAMAYEYKPQYVDIIMEELKDSKDMEVYDISKLGTGAKISVPKTEIDYAYAEEKGYRLIDASTLQWMNIAGTEGNGSVVSNHFSAFDREYFDTFHDSHYHRDFGNPVADTMNTYLRALEKANAQASSTIKKFQKNSKDAFEQNESKSHNVQRIANINRTLAKNLTALMPEANEDTLYSTVNELTRLNQDKNHPFYIVDAEEDITKKAKIAKFIESKNPTVDKKLLDSKMENIFNLYTDAVEINEYMSKDFIPKTPKDKMMKLYKPLYEVAAMHRTAIDKSLDIEENRMNMIEELRMNENSSKADVMKKLENKGEIVSEEILRGLQTKYNRIAKHAAVVEKAEVKGDVVKVEGLYDIEPKEVAALKNVLANLNNIHNSLKAETRFMQETMNDVLNAQAKQIGFETGSNWVSKEGSSGLSRPQQIRIFEQMTGQRFYAEKSLDRTAEFIKDSNHSGITASNVYHNDHGWHAMYVADLAQVPVKNAQTGKMETKDAIMYDNSWGYAEKKNTWVDSNGLERTDYACGRGGDTGYITNKLWQNGTLVDDYKNKPGVVGDYKFRMFTEAVLPTSKTLATNDTQEIFNSILTNRAQNTQRLALLENAIKKGDIKLKDIKQFQIANQIQGQINSMMGKYNEHFYANIKSEEDWNKVPETELAKRVLKRAAIAASLESPETVELANSHVKMTDAQISEKVYDIAVKEFVSAIKETPIEYFNLGEYQIDVDKHYGMNKTQLVKEWIDRVYDPEDDRTFGLVLKGLQAKTAEELTKLVKNTATQAEMGIKNVSSYDMLKAYQNEDPMAKKVVDQIVFTDSLNMTVGSNKIGTQPNELYSKLNRDFYVLKNAEQIKAIAPQMLAKHGVRAAFPEYSMHDDNQMRATAQQVMGILDAMVAGINNATNKNEKQQRIKQLSLTVKDNVELTIDKEHRNKVKHLLNQYALQATRNNNDKKEDYAAQIEDAFARHSILKDINKVFDEYLEILATNGDPEIAKHLRNYIVMSFDKVCAAELQSTVMHAVSKGRAHEIGEQLLNSTLQLPNANGGLSTIEVSKDNSLIVELTDIVTELSGAAAAATIFNAIALSERVMEAIDKAFDFEIVKKQLTKANVKDILVMLQEKSKLLAGLKFAKGSPAEAMRINFFNNATKFIKQISK